MGPASPGKGTTTRHKKGDKPYGKSEVNPSIGKRKDQEMRGRRGGKKDVMCVSISTSWFQGERRNRGERTERKENEPGAPL